MKIHFSASSHAEAKTRFDSLTRLYGQNDLDNADFIVYSVATVTCCTYFMKRWIAIFQFLV